MSDVATHAFAIVEAAICEAVPAVVSGRVAVFATPEALRRSIDAPTSGEVVVVIELQRESTQLEVLALHRMVARVQARVRVVVRSHLGPVACHEVFMAAPGTFDVDARTVPSRYALGALARLEESGGLMPGAAYAFPRNVELHDSDHWRWESSLDLRSETGLVHLDRREAVEVLVQILHLCRSRMPVAGPLNMRLQLATDAASLELLAPLELIDLLCRDEADVEQLLDVYRRLVRGGIVGACRAGVPSEQHQPSHVFTEPSSPELFYVFGGHVNMKDKVGDDEPQHDLLAEAGLIYCNLVVLRDRRNEAYMRGISLEVNSAAALLTYLGAIRDGIPHAETAYAYGQSSGGFAAIWFGYQLGLPAVWAFGLPTYQLGDVDLRTLLRRSNGVTTYHLYYNESYVSDRLVAEAMADLPGVRLFPQAGTGHFVGPELSRQKKLATLFPIAGR